MCIAGRKRETGRPRTLVPRGSEQIAQVPIHLDRHEAAVSRTWRRSARDNPSSSGPVRSYCSISWLSGSAPWGDGPYRMMEARHVRRVRDAWAARRV